ncbi:MAG: pantoate--beta-alanine ligase [Ilumatobacteraceae bacterium]
MDVLVTPNAMQDWARARQATGARLGIVPTMGALHAGHSALVEAVAERADVCVVTIFVNPLQFNQSTDFDSYPRPIDDDLRICAAAGVEAVYAPTSAAMYPHAFQTHVEPGELADRLEGPMRPGHFRGVATVVTKLLAATRADVAAFGEKDYQQLAIIRRMVADLDVDVEIVGVPIVRHLDGVAISSRNVRLTPAARDAAVVLSQALTLARRAHAAGERDADALTSLVTAHVAGEPLAALEYADVVDADTLEPVALADAPSIMLLAAWFGDVRLIDNTQLRRP